MDVAEADLSHSIGDRCCSVVLLSRRRDDAPYDAQEVGGLLPAFIDVLKPGAHGRLTESSLDAHRLRARAIGTKNKG